MKSTPHKIIIAAQPFNCGFDIKIEPPVTWAHYDVERPTHHEALRYAKSLKTLHGWPIDDQIGGVE
jgi:hypothetical protein